MRLGANLTTPVAAKLRISNNTDWGFTSGMVIVHDLMLSGTRVTAVVDWTQRLPVGVDNSLGHLAYEISVDGGATYDYIGGTHSQFFIVMGTPEGYEDNPHVTAKRLDLVTTIAKAEAAALTIAPKISEWLKVNVGFTRTNAAGNDWNLVDSGTDTDCIGLTGLAVKQLQMLGIDAWDSLAHASSDMTVTGREFATINGKHYVLGFHAAEGQNVFEGFFQFRVPGGGFFAAFTVVPSQGPIFESVDPRVPDPDLGANRLAYEVIKQTLARARAGGGDNGQQYWYEVGKLDERLDDTPVPFPGLP